MKSAHPYDPELIKQKIAEADAGRVAERSSALIPTSDLNQTEIEKYLSEHTSEAYIEPPPISLKSEYVLESDKIEITSDPNSNTEKVSLGNRPKEIIALEKYIEQSISKFKIELLKQVSEIEAFLEQPDIRDIRVTTTISLSPDQLKELVKVQRILNGVFDSGTYSNMHASKISNYLAKKISKINEYQHRN